MGSEQEWDEGDTNRMVDRIKSGQNTAAKTTNTTEAIGIDWIQTKSIKNIQAYLKYYREFRHNVEITAKCGDHVWLKRMRGLQQLDTAKTANQTFKTKLKFEPAAVIKTRS
jgi:hypothetical protein